MANNNNKGNSQNVHQLMDGYTKCGGTFTQLNFGNEKNKVPIHVKIQENPGNILSERSHSQKATNCIILFTRKVQGRQICRNRGKTENKE